MEEKRKSKMKKMEEKRKSKMKKITLIAIVVIAASAASAIPISITGQWPTKKTQRKITQRKITQRKITQRKITRQRIIRVHNTAFLDAQSWCRTAGGLKYIEIDPHKNYLYRYICRNTKK